MKHPEEEELVSYYYGDADDPATIEQHISSCTACRANYQELESLLSSVEVKAPPEPGEDFPGQVWRGICWRLDERPRTRWREWVALRRLVPAAVMVLLLVGFLVGRYGLKQQPQRPQGIPKQVRERILLIAVGDHLERSQLVLVELLNEPANGAVDISTEQRRAEGLLTDNRLYRETARRAGYMALSAVLEELERILLEIRHGSSTLSSDELNRIRRNIEDQGILFRIRVLDTGIQEREKELRRAPVRAVF